MTAILKLGDVTSTAVECACCGGYADVYVLELNDATGIEVRVDHHQTSKVLRLGPEAGSEVVKEQSRALVNSVLCCPGDWD